MDPAKIETQTDLQDLLAQARQGSSEAQRLLFDHLYEEMKKIALAYMRRERNTHTLSATGLVHEAFLRLVDDDINSQNHRQWLALAAIAMRRVLIDHARRRSAGKRDAGQRVTWRDSALGHASPSVYLLHLDEALKALEKTHQDLAKVVELRFFGGLSIEETAAALDLSSATVKRRWRLARAWLQRELQDGRNE